MSIYISVNQQTTGPFEENAVISWLRTGQLSPELLAWREGASAWQPLRNLFPVPPLSMANFGAQPVGYPMLPNPQSVLTQQRACEKCGQQAGDTYSFYFGKKISATSRRVGNRVVTTTRYDVAGKQDGAACHGCVLRRKLIMTAMFVLLVAVCALVGWSVYLEIFGPMRWRWEGAMAIFFMLALFAAGLGLLLGIAFLLENLFGSRAFHGDNLLIALRKGKLRQQGFNAFWNTASYRRLRRR